MVIDLVRALEKVIPITFQKNQPINENDFNDKLEGILKSLEENYEREFPIIKVALAKAKPDHSLQDYDLLIESKFIRGSTTPSVVSEGIAADLTKYPEGAFILFVVYDPNRSIKDDFTFSKDFEAKRKNLCKISIIR